MKFLQTIQGWNITPKSGLIFVQIQCYRFVFIVIFIKWEWVYCEFESVGLNVNKHTHPFAFQEISSYLCSETFPVFKVTFSPLIKFSLNIWALRHFVNQQRISPHTCIFRQFYHFTWIHILITFNIMDVFITLILWNKFMQINKLIIFLMSRWHVQSMDVCEMSTKC